ncbi:hypothetical protein ACOQFV_07515 [Nocardiopsis changdeensis]|uniref:Uncharacterized protein n=1 Tax=Nocardiopsis changdeensis TaxID=2831969 RepID=A0ABX8BI07_9ACTN|nr:MULTISPECIES: hypothetical protein [Nocardiopsis]QUX20586.1 hypothetical protein KGD84_18955 [Nocardiopsis changdeensis]QYX36517.1 hypothetical protein K1J57_28410 [Nocardiopsis sp. MT53]
MSRHISLARARAAATGETHLTAAKAIAALPAESSIIPEATLGQAHLETDLLLGLRDLIYMGPPYDVPVAVTRRTPARDGLVLEIARPHLTDTLTLWLPYTDIDGEFHGIPGLRARHRGHRLELRLLSQDATVTIPVSRAQWGWARTHVHAVHDYRGTPLWAQDPTCLTAVERDTLARRRKRFHGPHAQHWYRLGSAMLRRLGLLTTHHVTGFAGHADLWRGLSWAGPLNMEWGRPHHVAALTEQLTDPSCPTALPAPLRHSVEHDSERSISRIRSARGIELQLRPCTASGDGPIWEWEKHLPLHGPYRAPHRRSSQLLPDAVRSLLIDAFTGDHASTLGVAAPQITARGGGGWNVSHVDGLLGAVGFLRYLAQSQRFADLWPRDLQDATDINTTHGPWRMVRICGVDVAFE